MSWQEKKDQADMATIYRYAELWLRLKDLEHLDIDLEDGIEQVELDQREGR